MRECVRPDGQDEDGCDLERRVVRQLRPAELGEEVDDRVLPEVDAEAALAEPAEPAEPRALERGADEEAVVGRQQQEHTEEHSHREHAPLVDVGRLAVKEEVGGNRCADEHGPGEIAEQHPVFAEARTRVVDPPEAEHGAKEQRVDARVRAVVEARDIHVRLVHHRHHSRRAEREQGEHREGRPAPGEDVEKRVEREEQRPDEVVLHLDAHEPEVRERRGIRQAREVVGILRDLPPVVVAEDDREKLRPDGRDGLRQHEGKDADRRQQHDEERRVDALDALPVVRLHAEAVLEPAALARVGEQKAREHEEEGDAEIAARQPLGEHVEERDADNRQRAQRIEPVDMPPARCFTSE